jgi:hypothetical protein
MPGLSIIATASDLGQVVRAGSIARLGNNLHLTMLPGLQSHAIALPGSHEHFRQQTVAKTASGTIHHIIPLMRIATQSHLRRCNPTH